MCIIQQGDMSCSVTQIPLELFMNTHDKSSLLKLSPRPPKNVGKLEIITGPMYSGKTTTLYKRLRLAVISNKKVLCMIHSAESKRCNKGQAYYTHNTSLNSNVPPEGVDSEYCDTLFDIEKIRNYDVIGIEEAQFFKDLSIIRRYVEEEHKRVIVSGLVIDSDRNIFGQLIYLEPFADLVSHKKAVCTNCSNEEAIFSHKIEKNGIQLEVGAKDKYIALCRHCYIVLNSSS